MKPLLVKAYFLLRISFFSETVLLFYTFFASKGSFKDGNRVKNRLKEVERVENL
jgi:hypothetical protein